MSGAFYSWLERGSWGRVGLLLAPSVAALAVFAIRDQVFLLGASSDPAKLLDTRFWYTPTDAREYLDRLGQSGRRLYAMTQLSLDIIFPVFYAGLLSSLFVRL